MNNIELLATDMDATLLNSLGQVPADFGAYVHLLRLAGVHVTIASGRSLHTLREMFPHYGMSFICDNGGLVYSDGHIINQSMIDTSAQRLMCGFISKQLGAVPVVCGIDAAYIGMEHRQYIPELSKFFSKLRIVTSLTQLPVPADKISAYFPNGDSVANIAAVRGRFAVDYAVTVSGECWIDLMNAGVNKGSALKLLGQHLGVDPTNMMAFGNADNDAEMLATVGYGYTVANADPAILASAEFQTGTNDEFGVLQVMQQLLQTKMRKAS
ncbi:HAD family hydrolase [Lacticaseibacillus hulanensis]|uniref:HAD family hydrolase n=1 Tax=Lacticaseibacillus hulanensis TaxID=2493111 RepID=UPI000FDC801D|nr:HAD family hydrolase [Lacticaseibacillus hulanensis]